MQSHTRIHRLERNSDIEGFSIITKMLGSQRNYEGEREYCIGANSTLRESRVGSKAGGDMLDAINSMKLIHDCLRRRVGQHNFIPPFFQLVDNRILFSATTSLPQSRFLLLMDFATIYLSEQTANSALQTLLAFWHCERMVDKAAKRAAAPLTEGNDLGSANQKAAAFHRP